MEKKSFKSRLFKRKIEPDEPDYWRLVLSEILFRLQEIEQLNCNCGLCITERYYYKHLIQRMMDELHIFRFRQPGFTGKGDCGRRSDDPLPPAA